MSRTELMLVVLLAGCLLAAPAVRAAPSISSTSGTVAHDSSIVVSGSGFGSKATAAPYKWDDFEDGSVGSYLSGWSLEAVPSSSYRPKYDNTRAHGTYSTKSALCDMSSNWNSNFSVYDGSGALNRIYVSVWYYLQTGGALTRQWKPMSINAGWGYYPQWRMGFMRSTYSGLIAIVNDDGNYAAESWPGDDTAPGYWTRREVCIDLGTYMGGDAVYKYWRDCALKGDCGPGVTARTHVDGLPIRVIRIGYYYAHDEGTPEPWGKVWCDDVYIDTTWQRVELGNASTWNACAHREIQIPSAWSSSSITVKVNQGSFSTGTAYVYVTDASGTPNSSGYAVTITGGAPTYSLTVNSGSGNGNYTENTVVNISADNAPSGYEFDAWVGDTDEIADVNDPTTTLTMPDSSQETTATYQAATLYTLTVNSGSGDGSYQEGYVTDISADAAASGKVFDEWTGHTSGCGDVNDATTTYTMPAGNAEITATYEDIGSTYTLTVNSGSGDGDYMAGQVADITADAAASGKFFDAWTGDTSNVADLNDPTTTITMPAANAELTATYESVVAGLVSRYSFDMDGRDNYGASDGTLTNGASATSDSTRGKVLILDGVDDYVALPADNMASGRSELTLCMWIKPDRWNGSDTIWDEYAQGAYWQFSVLAGNWYTRDTSSGSTGARNNDLAMPSLTTGQWHHLALVYSVTDTEKAIYHDGALHASTSDSVDTLTSERDGVGIGYPCDGTYFDGLVDDVRLYSRALSEAEIAIIAGQAEYMLTVNSGSGDGTYVEDEVVNIAADDPASGKVFDDWTGDTAGIANVADPTTTITMPASNAEITATYQDTVTYTLTVNSGTGDGDYAPGTVVDVTADAAPTGQMFDEWVGDTEGLAAIDNSTTTITMGSANAEITATYATYWYHLTVNSGSGDGDYAEDTVVNISADTPPSGQEFDQWTGDTSVIADVGSADTTVTIPASTAEVTATYTDKTWTLTVNSGTGDGSYVVDTVVDIDADGPASGKQFDEWVGYTAGIASLTSASTTLTMPYGNAEITATYEDAAAGTTESIHFREGGGGSYTDVTFDDAYLNVNPADDTTHGNQGYNGIQCSSIEVSLIAIKDLFTELPVTSGGNGIVITSATLHVFRYSEGSSSITVSVYPVTTNWLPDSAGSNENDVSGEHAEKSSTTTWASGDFSSSDYDGSVVDTGSWVNGYDEECELDVTDVIAEIYDDEINYGMVLFADGSLIGRASENPTNKPSLEITYSYPGGQTTYTLTVNSGSGDGSYAESAVVDIDADAAPSSSIFAEWVGDTTGIADVADSSTTITMPASNAEITATYTDITYTLTVNSGAGDGTYMAATIVDVAADAAASGKVFDQWTGDTGNIADMYESSTTVTMPASNVEITATYVDAYTLTVNSGSGDGVYLEDTVVAVQADSAPSGTVFDGWAGDTGHIANPASPATTVTMPAGDIEITATYVAIPTYTLTVNSGSGDGSYGQDEVVDITADAAGSGEFFDAWTGDTSRIADINDPTTTITMETSNVEVTATYAEVVSGLVSRYTFDVDARDTYGTNDGTLANNATVTNDATRGLVVSLDGTADYVDLPADAMAAGRSELTLSMWINPDEWVSSNTLWDEYDGAYWQFSISEGTWYTRDSSTGSMGTRDNDVSMPTVGTGAWHHLAFVYSVSGGVKEIYYDGAPSGSSTTSIDALTSDRQDARIGYPCDGTYYDGLIDDVRLYSRALNSTEIALLAETTPPTTYTLTVNSGSGDGDYAEDAVADIDADTAPSGQDFDEWVGDTSGIASVSTADTTLTMPASNQEITATYTDKTWTLTVNSGTGDGSYVVAAVVDIDADTPASGKQFDEWVGDTAGIADVDTADTTLTMPYADVEITATYEDVPSGTTQLIVNWGSSSGNNVYDFSDWDSVYLGPYTAYSSEGPDGIKGGFTGMYHTTGVNGSSESFSEGDQIKVTWYNYDSSGKTISPKISFDDEDYYSGGVSSGTWYDMTQQTIPAEGSAATTYTFTSGTAGSYSRVHVSRATNNAEYVICDKIELVTD